MGHLKPKMFDVARIVTREDAYFFHVLFPPAFWQLERLSETLQIRWGRGIL